MADAFEEFGPYAVYERLGQGGMATVHRAEKRGVGIRRPIALKRLLPHVAADPALVKLFVDEARLAGHLHHSNVAQTYELGKVGDTFFIAMEYASGPTLAQIVRQCQKAAGEIPLTVTVNILSQVCEALDYAHNLCDESGQPLRIIHRDVSPANIIVTNTGIVKLIDFGIAKATISSVKTQTGFIKGKFGYIAPEYITGKIDARVDLFAIGVVAHEMLAGRRLFEGKDDFETLQNIREMNLRPPSHWNPHVTADLDDIVMTALQRNPADRWQSASAMLVALAHVARELGILVGSQQLSEWVAWAFSQLPGARRAPAPIASADDTDALGRDVRSAGSSLSIEVLRGSAESLDALAAEPGPDDSLAIEAAVAALGAGPVAASVAGPGAARGASHGSARSPGHDTDASPRDPRPGSSLSIEISHPPADDTDAFDREPDPGSSVSIEIHRSSADSLDVHRASTDSFDVHHPFTDSFDIHPPSTDSFDVHRAATDSLELTPRPEVTPRPELPPRPEPQRRSELHRRPELHPPRSPSESDETLPLERVALTAGDIELLTPSPVIAPPPPAARVPLARPSRAHDAVAAPPASPGSTPSPTPRPSRPFEAAAAPVVPLRSSRPALPFETQSPPPVPMTPPRASRVHDAVAAPASPPVPRASRTIDATPPPPPIPPSGERHLPVPPPVPPSGERHLPVPPSGERHLPVPPSGERRLPVPPPVPPSGERDLFAPPPIPPSGERELFAPPPIPPSGERDLFAPSPSGERDLFAPAPSAEPEPPPSSKKDRKAKAKATEKTRPQARPRADSTASPGDTGPVPRRRRLLWLILLMVALGAGAMAATYYLPDL